MIWFFDRGFINLPTYTNSLYVFTPLHIAHLLFYALPDLESLAVAEPQPFNSIVEIITPGFTIPEHARQFVDRIRTIGVQLNYTDRIFTAEEISIKDKVLPP
jgi:hypothetical protein